MEMQTQPLLQATPALSDQGGLSEKNNAKENLSVGGTPLEVIF